MHINIRDQIKSLTVAKMRFHLLHPEFFKWTCRYCEHPERDLKVSNNNKAKCGENE